MSKGEAAFVLPQCENMPYITIEEGDMFGILDLVPESRETVIDKEIQRQFTVMALDYSDILCLSLEVRTSSLTVQHLQSINHNYPAYVSGRPGRGAAFVRHHANLVSVNSVWTPGGDSATRSRRCRAGRLAAKG